MPTVDEINNKLQALGYTTIPLSIRGEVKYLTNVLHPDEDLRGIIDGIRGGNNAGTWLVACTNERIIFLYKKLLFGMEQFTIPLEKVSSVDHETGLMFGWLKIWDGVTSTKIEQIAKAKLPSFLDAINKALSEIRKGKIPNSPTVTVSQAVDVADQLKKLAELKNQGILTEEEFQSQKTKLLGL